MKITVTQKQIDEGVPGSGKNSPVAKAIAEKTNDEERYAEVSILGIFYYVDGIHYRVDIPPAVREFIDRFDSGLPVEPFTFELKGSAP